ncbi:hypothetical protein Q4R94_18515 [Morganella morganii]
MNPTEFIRKNIINELEKLGYQGGVLDFAADRGLDHYRRCSQATRRGGMFDDCLRVAKLWAEKYGQKPSAGTKKKAKASRQVSMF